MLKELLKMLSLLCAEHDTIRQLVINLFLYLLIAGGVFQYEKGKETF